MMKKAISIFILTTTILLIMPMQVVMAQDPPAAESTTSNASEIGTFLPTTETKTVDCIKVIKDFDTKYINADSVFAGEPAAEKNKILACAIKTGRVKFWMIPYFFVYVIDFMIKLSGLIAVLFIVIGGYKYVVAGATDDKDGAKTTITNALLGLVVVLTAWAVVNMIQFAVTF